MVFVFSLIRGLAAVFRLLAASRHNRAQAVYEQRQTAFKKAEQDCKADEVRLGRPMDYAGQLRLLKLYEAAETARQIWVRRANVLNRWKSREAVLLGFRGRKLPYTFGMVDMAMIMEVADQFGVGLDLPQLGDWITAWL